MRYLFIIISIVTFLITIIMFDTISMKVLIMNSFIMVWMALLQIAYYLDTKK
jgi:hypothetical protein